ncbi:MAG TPA: helix-turn-helix domain-containing protein [Blastocatellia bacterium]|nr:helix-turn-helix domain-containing protein [Blastocatellia bacterium]
MSHEQLASIRQRVLSAYNVPDLGELARRVEISYQKLQHYFIGRTQISTDLLLRLSADTHVSIHWLLTGEGEKYPGINQAQSQQLGNQLDERRAKQREIFDLVAQFNELPDQEKIALSNKIVGLVANYLLSACDLMEVKPAGIKLISILAVNVNDPETEAP